MNGGTGRSRRFQDKIYIVGAIENRQKKDARKITETVNVGTKGSAESERMADYD